MAISEGSKATHDPVWSFLYNTSSAKVKLSLIKHIAVTVLLLGSGGFLKVRWGLKGVY